MRRTRAENNFLKTMSIQSSFITFVPLLPFCAKKNGNREKFYTIDRGEHP